MEKMGRDQARASSAAYDTARRTSEQLHALGVNLEQPVSVWIKGPRWGELLGRSKMFAADSSEPGGRGWFARQPIGRYLGKSEEEVQAIPEEERGPVHRRFALTVRGAVELHAYLASPSFETKAAAAETQAARRAAREEASERSPMLELVELGEVSEDEPLDVAKIGSELGQALDSFSAAALQLRELADELREVSL